MNKILVSGLMLLPLLGSLTSCNADFTDEQYAHYVGFVAPLATSGTSVGVTTVYVPYTRYNSEGEPRYGEKGISHYNLPVEVCGSTINPNNLTVHIAHSDTLPTLNMERFSTRQELYYIDMSDYATYPSTIDIQAGKDVALLNIKFDFRGIDLSDRYLLPLTIDDGTLDYTDLKGQNFGYQRNPRKNYATAMLRVLPYTDFSGVYQATNMKFYIVSGGINDQDPGGMTTVQTYTVNENNVFFYAGTFNESSLLRKNFKVYAEFRPYSEGAKRGDVILTCDNPEMNFKQNKVATYTILESMDEVQTYILRRTVIVNDIDYTFSDYLTSPGAPISYNIVGTMAMERKLNTQMPEEDQIIFE